ncbi:hypothetical protein LJB42_002380 [Komagataella kurtzmanii]|nr:hypothetical protein LJB42_002380 [Komagataella kurtzmanii]
MSLDDWSSNTSRWSRSSVYYYSNLVLDKFGRNQVGLYNSRGKYGPKNRNVKHLIHPFQYEGTWNVAILLRKNAVRGGIDVDNSHAFSELGKETKVSVGELVLINCSPNDPRSEFPVDVCFNIDQFILETGQKLRNRSLKNFSRVENLFPIYSKIDALNVLGVVFTMCCSSFFPPYLASKSLSQYKKFNISRFYDLYFNDLEPETIFKAELKFIHFDKFPRIKEHIESSKLKNLDLVRTKNFALDSRTPIDEGLTNAVEKAVQPSKSSSFSLRKKQLNGSNPHNQSTNHKRQKLESVLQFCSTHASNFSIPDTNLFNRNICGDFLATVTPNIEAFPSQSEVFYLDDLMEMIENWYHPSQVLSERPLLVRESTIVCLSRRNSIIYDGEEFDELQKTDHSNQVLPFFYERKSIYLVNFQTSDNYHTTVNCIEITRKNNSRDVSSSLLLRKMVENYVFKYSRKVIEINTTKYYIPTDNFSCYLATTTMIYFLHRFLVKSAFDIDLSPPFNKIQEYTEKLESLLYGVYDGDVISRNNSYLEMMTFLNL